MRKILTVAALAVLFAASGVAQERQVYKAGKDGVTSPVLVKEVKPSYTKDAMDRRVEGRVEVQAIIQADGTVGNVTITASLDPDLDQEAIKAVKQWRFRPGTKDDTPVDVECSIEMTFHLK